MPSIEEGGRDYCGLCADWRTDCLAHLGAPDQPSACEMGWATRDYRFCWPGRFGMAELGLLEHPVQKFGPILAL